MDPQKQQHMVITRLYSNRPWTWMRQGYFKSNPEFNGVNQVAFGGDPVRWSKVCLETLR